MNAQIGTIRSDMDFQQKTDELQQQLNEASSVLLGAGPGLSPQYQTYFEERFSDFKEKYNISDLYTGSFYPFETLEIYWAFWSRYILLVRYENSKTPTYEALRKILRGKDHFILTTNVDALFVRNGFRKSRIYPYQGDMGEFQCSAGCHDATYANEERIRAMVKEQKDLRIPTDLIPYCPRCHAPMSVHVRVDHGFLENAQFLVAKKAFRTFVDKYAKKPILYWEMGVAETTPVIVRYPLWRFTAQNKSSTFITINPDSEYVPREIQKRSIVINGDISEVLAMLT